MPWACSVWAKAHLPTVLGLQLAHRRGTHTTAGFPESHCKLETPASHRHSSLAPALVSRHHLALVPPLLCADDVHSLGEGMASSREIRGRSQQLSTRHLHGGDNTQDADGGNSKLLESPQRGFDRFLLMLVSTRFLHEETVSLFCTLSFH